MFDRTRIAAIALPVLLAVSAPAWAQEEAASDPAAAYKRALTCEVIYTLLSEDTEDQSGEAQFAAFLAETWHEYLSTTYPEGFEERHDLEFGAVADSLVDSLNAMDDASFETAVDQILTTCETMDASASVPG
ncbi:MAG TPA: hypothetical protein VL094_11585 [Sphingomonadaceae bacterium]|nr:hypothetical protein [Sphingomonadaceae bacterium]